MRYILYAGLVLLLVTLCVPPASAESAVSAESAAPPARQVKKPRSDAVPRDSGETVRYWKMARKYKNQMRYELARQHYLLALASSRSDQTVQRIQRELQIVELQIRSLR